MKTIKSFVYIAALSAAVLFSGCKEEMVDNMSALPISFEQFNDNGKAYISGQFACWENGDVIRLSKTSDGTNYSSYDGSIAVSYPSGAPVAEATASGFSTAPGDVVFCGYVGNDFSGTIRREGVEIALPDTYTYSESLGNQKVACPMVGGLEIQAYEEGQTNPNVLKLRNLCCLLRIKLDKPTSGAYTLDKIVVVNTTGTTPMYGAGEVTFSGFTPTLNMVNTSLTKDRVILDLTSNPVPINETRYFYVPIPPQAANQDYKILIHNQLTGNWMNSTIHSVHAIPGNTIATIQGPSTNEPTPAPYEFYDYLVNNNGNSYIDLGLVPSNTSKMEMTFMLGNSMDITQTMYLSGSRRGAGQVFYFSFTGPSNKNYFAASFMWSSSASTPNNACNTSGTSITRQTNQKYRFTTEVKEGTTGYYYTDVTYEKLNNAGATTALITRQTGEVEGGIPSDCSSPILLYATHTDNTIIAGLKVYSYKVWDDGVLQHNFVPAKRNSDGHYGMYDMSTSTFVDGSTHGSFTAGND